MKNSYICPSCRSHLKVVSHITFSVITSGGKAGLLLLSPELGDYSVIYHDSLTIEEGEHVDFFCPVCHENLGAKSANPDFAEVILIDENGKEYRLVFSVIAGKKCTFKIAGNSILEAFGDDADEYFNFWGETPKY
ncbi:MAG: hypothetical protein JXA03_14285 [Bacteroidales bacterium]|nr:hypothetical protein [Bacteroidales bacterium]